MPWVHSRCSSASVEWPAFARLLLGDRGTQHDVAEQRRRGVGALDVVALVVQLVHREREDVRRAGLVHEVHVQRRHRVDVDEPDRQLDQRVDPHVVEHEPREPLEFDDVDVDARLVGDLDAHRAVAVGQSATGAGLSARAVLAASRRRRPRVSRRRTSRRRRRCR